MPGTGGTSIRIFLPTGDPDGLRVITRSHWTGLALVCSRAQYATARLSRDEFARPRVYALVGPSDSDASSLRIYVGEGEVLRERLDQHNRTKDFWTRLIAFSSSGGELNKALIKYIESRLVMLANDAGRAEVDNGNVPPRPALSEADQADAEAFLADMLVIYPLVGVSAFESVPGAPVTPDDEDLFVRSTRAEARGREVADEFVVFKGARLAPTQQSLAGSLLELRATLVDEGKIAESEDGSYELLADRPFKSPSYAASFVLGRNANGRTEWKNSAGLSLSALAGAEPAALAGT